MHYCKLDTTVHAYNSSWEAEAGRTASLRQAWAILSQTKKGCGKLNEKPLDSMPESSQLNPHTAKIKKEYFTSKECKLKC